MQQGLPQRLPAGQAAIAAGVFEGGGFEGGEQLAIADDAVFDHLGHAGAKLLDRQRCQHAGVDQHQPWLVKGADQVLAARMVDAGLATDRRIHHGQQGGGHLHHGDAPQPGGGGETGHVADDAAAEGHDQRTALQFGRKGGVMDQGDGGRCFLIFAGLNHQG